MRTFATGATRDTESGKFEYSGFLSPVVLRAFAAYMHRHRVQADGTVRSSRNWRKGIPIEVYGESLARHWQDVWAHLEGFTPLANEPILDALCGMLFNVQGLIHEIVIRDLRLNRGRTT